MDGETIGAAAAARHKLAAAMLFDRTSREALEERCDRILREHGAALRRLAAAYEARPQEREDLLQEIALALWKALPGFRGDCSERTFVFRIAHNRALTHCWRRRPPTEDLEAAETLPAPVLSPESAAGEAQRRAHLGEAIRRLPLPQRQIVTLSLEGLDTKEIADVLGITENNAAVRLTRARKALRASLGVAAEGS